ERLPWISGRAGHTGISLRPCDPWRTWARCGSRRKESQNRCTRGRKNRRKSLYCCTAVPPLTRSLSAPYTETVEIIKSFLFHIVREIGGEGGKERERDNPWT